MTDLPPPVTSDVTLDDVEAYLDRQIAKKTPLPRSGATTRQGKRDTEDEHEQG